MTVEERVARGAALLDEKMPGWYKRIDLGSLHMSSCHACILGQLYTEYSLGVAALDINSYQKIDNGFNDDQIISYAALAKEWRRVIEARRGQEQGMI